MFYQNERISEGRRKEIPEMQYVAQERGKPKSQNGSCAEYGTPDPHWSKRKDNSKKDVPKGRKGEKMGKREGTEICLTTEKCYLFPLEEKRK